MAKEVNATKKGGFFYFVAVWALFFLVVLAYFLVVKYWYNKYFIYYLSNTDSFLEAISLAYQAVVNSQNYFLDFSVFLEKPFFEVGEYWPALSHMIGLWALLFLPLKLFFLPNIFYLSMIMLAIYHSMRILIGDRFYSMMAAAIFASYWMVTILTLSFDVHLAATACIAWGFYWFLRCRFFTKFLESAMLGIFTVLALFCDRLTPFVFLGCLFLIPENFRNKRSLFFMAIVLSFVTVCCWPFYSRWVKEILVSSDNLKRLFSQGPCELLPLEAYKMVFSNPGFLIAHLSYYFISLTEQLLGYGFTALFIIGIFSLRQLNKREVRIIWIAMLIPLFVFMLVVKKEYIYIFPLCIYFAMVSGMGLFFIRQAYARYILICAIAGLFVWQLFCILSPSPQALFLSKQFDGMEKGVPLLFRRSAFDGVPDNGFKKALSVTKEMAPLFNSASFLNSYVIVHLKSPHRQTLTVFLLNRSFPRVSFIGAPYANDASTFFNKDFLYVLSDKGNNGFPYIFINDLDVPGLKNALKGNAAAHQVIRRKLAFFGIAEGRSTAQDLATALNEVLKMHDFHSQIEIETVQSSLDEEMRNTLVKAQNNDRSLKEGEYMRLNRALLEAIYPQKIQKRRDGEMCIEGHCWRNVKPEHSFKDSDIVLYRLQ